MERLDVAVILLIIGLGGTFLTSVALIIFRKRTGIDSFTIRSRQGIIEIRCHKTVTLFNTIEVFFAASMFAVLAAFEKYDLAASLSVVYAGAFLFALHHYYSKNKFRILIDTWDNTLLRNNKKYDLKEFSEWEIGNRNILVYYLFALYLKSPAKKYRLVYGYSIKEDIEKLKSEIEKRMKRE